MEDADLSGLCERLAADVAKELADHPGKRWRCPSDLRTSVVSYAGVCREGTASRASTRKRLLWSYGWLGDRIDPFGAGVRLHPDGGHEGFDGLHGIITSHLERDLLSGDLNLFVARNQKRAKVLLWDGTGLCLYAKRVEKGQFAKLWAGEETTTLELTMSELSLFLEGSRLVGKVAVSPQNICIKCLMDHRIINKIEYAKAGKHPRSRNAPADSHSP